MDGSRRIESLILSVCVMLMLCQPPVGGTFLPADARMEMHLRIQTHKETVKRLRAVSNNHTEPHRFGNEVHRPSRLLASSPVPIRILPEYQLPASLSASAQAAIEQVVSAAIMTLQEYLQVKIPVGASGLLAAPQFIDAAYCAAANQGAYPGKTCSGPGWSPTFSLPLPSSDIKAPFCGSAKINASHVLATGCMQSTVEAIPGCAENAAGTSGGMQTDLYIYVTSDTTGCDPDVAAFAMPCLFDLLTGRPVMGMLNLCQAVLMNNSPDKLLATVVHEMTHVLGFTDDLFKSYIDANGNPLQLSDIVQAVPATSSSNMRGSYNIIVTPTVVREVRAQFNCPTLAGAALEDQGGAGSANSHWEYELFQGELMTPSAPADGGAQWMSRVTLALLQDSGWYIGNWSATTYLNWGFNEGCNMPLLKCAAYADITPDQPYYCNTTANPTSMCTFDGQSRGVCAESPFSVCGLVNTPPPAVNVPPEPSCTSSLYSNAGATAQAIATGSQAFGWAIGSNARCLQTSLPLVTTTAYINVAQPTTTSYCWNATCGTDGTLYYNIHSNIVACPSGTTIVFSNFDNNFIQGSATCPSNAQVCRTLQQCPSGCDSVGGECFSGQCTCKLGYTGADCSNALMGVALPPTEDANVPDTTDTSLSQSNDGNASSGFGLSGSTRWIVIVVASVVGAIIVAAVLGVFIVSWRRKRQQQMHQQMLAPSSYGGPYPGSGGALPEQYLQAFYNVAAPAPAAGIPPYNINGQLHNGLAYAPPAAGTYPWSQAPKGPPPQAYTTGASYYPELQP